jgi:glycogen operon protein
MIAHGDEMSRTQRGNNNVYCQDNELSWVDWETARDAFPLLEFTQAVTELRRKHPVLRRRRFFHGRPLRGTTDGLSDIEWLRPNGTRMSDHDWVAGYAKSMGVFLNGEAISEPDTRGQRVRDDSFLMLFNAHYEDLAFTMPDGAYGSTWEVVLDTATPVRVDRLELKAGSPVDVEARSMMVLRRVI